MNQATLNLEPSVPTLVDIVDDETDSESSTLSDAEVVAEMKASLSGKLNELVDRLTAARIAAVSLNSFLDCNKLRSTDLVPDCEAINIILHQFLKSECASWSAWAKHVDGQDTTGEISLEDLPAELTSINAFIRETWFKENTPSYDTDLAQTVEWLLANYDFNYLLDSLQEKANSLADTKYRECADKLISELGLHEMSGYRKPKLTSKGLVIELGIRPCYIMNNYDYKTKEQCYELSALFEEVEKATGIDGLSASFTCLREAFEEDNSPRPSREKLKPALGAVEFTFFNEKIKATIPTSLVAPLIAFLKHNSDKPLKSL